jgi:hypothetical protein
MSQGLTKITLSQSGLANSIDPDVNITGLTKRDPNLHRAISNLAKGTKLLIGATFPPLPTGIFEKRIISGGVQAVGTDQLVHQVTIILPTDPLGYYQCESVTLNSCTTTLKTASASGSFVSDILIRKNHGTSPFTSIFRPNARPTVPQGKFTSGAGHFAINTVNNYDQFRWDVITADGTAADVELVLIGFYNWTQINN